MKHTRDAAFWAATIGLAPLVAWAACAIGLGLAVREPAVDLLVLALWSVSEEVVFRGALQPFLAGRIERRLTDSPRAAVAGITLANAATSACFALVHLWRHTPLAAASVFPVSLVLGHARDRTGSLWPPVVLHLWFNGLLYAASWLALPLA